MGKSKANGFEGTNPVCGVKSSKGILLHYSGNSNGLRAAVRYLDCHDDIQC